MIATTALRRLPHTAARAGFSRPCVSQRALLASNNAWLLQKQPTQRNLSSSSSSSSSSTTKKKRPAIPHPPLFCRQEITHLPASVWKLPEKEVTIVHDKDDRDGVPCIDATLLLDSKCSLGEGIVYDDVRNCLYWTDINFKHFYALNLPNDEDLQLLRDTKHVAKIAAELTQVTLPQRLGSFAMLLQKEEEKEDENDNNDSSPGFLCAWEDGFQLCRLLPTSTAQRYSKNRAIRHWMDWQMSSRSVGEPVNPQGLPTRLNDGRCDPTGRRFICGGYYGEQKDVYMKVFQCEVDDETEMNHTRREEPPAVDSDAAAETEAETEAASTVDIPTISLRHKAIYENIQVTNSICFDKDNNNNTIMYLADSPKRTITKLPYDTANGTLDVSQQQFLHSTGTLGVPDGSCIDSECHLWNAVWRSGAGPSFAQRIHPTTGEVVFRVNIPKQGHGHGTSQVACCCLGGPDLDLLFLSTAAENRDPAAEPHAGGIYVARVPVPGRPEVRFRC